MCPASGDEFLGSFTRSFPPDLNAPYAARHALKDLNGQVDEDLLERGGLVVTELVSNSVRHARLGPEHQINLRVWARHDLLRVEVRDAGDGFDPTPTRPNPSPSDDGWGLWIVAQLADRWGIDTSRSTRVWCEFEPRDDADSPGGGPRPGQGSS
jgi:anti-sigma regulatory factor (Ser/Thr protein kinase)